MRLASIPWTLIFPLGAASPAHHRFVDDLTLLRRSEIFVALQKSPNATVTIPPHLQKDA